MKEQIKKEQELIFLKHMIDNKCVSLSEEINPFTGDTLLIHEVFILKEKK